VEDGISLESAIYRNAGMNVVDEAAGILLGMVTSAPRCAAIFGHVPLPSRSQIEARVRTCAALFLRGCQVAETP
jgi:hypothetical protein